MDQISQEQRETVILVGVVLGDEKEQEECMDELAELTDTAGAREAGRVTQNRESFHPATYIGKGKIDEVRTLLNQTHAGGIICDDELSPAQIHNLEEALETKVMDRTLLILDIFAQRAFTREGKIQVELAQLRYRAARLTGQGTSLSRLGGGIGTRGPGEKKLEVDRRRIHQRISHLKKELQGVIRHRQVQRSQREKNHIPVVCLVGYTNAGKSTLLNYYTDAGVMEADQLFATLDPVTKCIRLDNGNEILLTDTVGFIRKLPHHLVDAFRSTLEEAKYSDVIVHVADATSPQLDSQMKTVYETLDKLGIKNHSIITAFNKIDRWPHPEILKDPVAKSSVSISGKDGTGTKELLALIEEQLMSQRIYVERIFGYSEAGKVQTIRKQGYLMKEEYMQQGIYIEAYVPKEIYGML